MTGKSQLFVRQSTGLVREASALDATIFNAVFSAPVGATLAWGVFFALSAFPGSDLIWATIISFLINIPVLVMMSLLASSMPRTGGDYVWVSRILSPPLALVSNFGAALSATIGATFWARYFPVFALGPILATRTLTALLPGTPVRSRRLLLEPLRAKAEALQLAQVEFVEIRRRISLGSVVVH